MLALAEPIDPPMGAARMNLVRDIWCESPNPGVANAPAPRAAGPIAVYDSRAERRSVKLARVQCALAEGTYRMPTADIADALVSRMLRG